MLCGELAEAFDRVVCLVDGSPESFGALADVSLLALPTARIVAITPFDLAAAARTRCRVEAIASAWDAQAQMVRCRAEAALGGRAGYARIVEGSSLSAIVRAARQERGTMLALPAATLRRGVLRRLLLSTDGSILVSRGALSERSELRLLVEDGLGEIAEDIGRRLGNGAVADPVTVVRRAVLTQSRSADLTVIRGDGQARRFLRSFAQTVADRASSSVLIVRPFYTGQAQSARSLVAEAEYSD